MGKILVLIIIIAVAASVILVKQIKCRAQNNQLLNNKTKDFLGIESDWRNVRIALLDVQGLEGGRNIFIFGSGETVVQSVNPNKQKGIGLFEERYNLSLGPSQIKELIKAFIEEDFLTITIKDRPGVPDEARPEIILVNPSGSSHKIAKWYNDFHQAFGALYYRLLSIAKKARNTKPILTRKWNGNDYRPKGWILLPEIKSQ